MKFGSIPVENAIGAILAHSVQADQIRFSKGRVLNAADIQSLARTGHKFITAALLGKNDVPENKAASDIGERFATQNIIAKPASTGRVNLHAAEAGLFEVNVKKINSINAIDPAITVATLANYSICQFGAMVATVKIIPFAAPASAVEKAGQLAETTMTLHRFKPLQVGLVQTILPLTKDSVLEKTVDVTRQRILRYGGNLSVSAHCDHASDALAETLHAMLGLDMLIVFGASAMCDISDVVPEAIRLIGGKVKQLGMPVDPGNLLVLGAKSKTTIIGAPGCARSIKENGFDWVLSRFFAGLKVTSRDIIGMGVGGLLMEIPSRPSPRSFVLSHESHDD